MTLDGSASTDPELVPLEYEWTTNCPGSFDDPSLSQPTFTMDSSKLDCRRICTLELTVNDGNYTVSCNTKLTVEDTAEAHRQAQERGRI